MSTFRANYEEFSKLMKSIPKNKNISLEMVPCKDKRVFLRVYVHSFNYPSNTVEKLKMFFMIEVYGVKELWQSKKWIDIFGVGQLKKVKGSKKVDVTFEVLGKSIVVQGSPEYIPVAIRFDEEGNSYEKSKMEAVQTVTITQDMYQQIKSVWGSVMVEGGRFGTFLIIETIDGEINIAATNGHVLTVKNTGIKCQDKYSFAMDTLTIQALFAPHWDTNLPLEIKLSEGNKNVLVCQRGKGKIWQSDADVKAPNYRSVIPTVYDYGDAQIKLPLIPKGLHAIRFTWEKTEKGKSKFHLKQEWSSRNPQENDLPTWEADAEVLVSNPRFPKDVDMVTWCFNRDLFCAGLKITDDIKKGVKFSMVDNQSAMQLKGNGYEFIIMPLNL